jgi:hypothetical protein
MHTIQTFVLHLFVDLDAPEILRGSLQAVTQKEIHPFIGEQMLGALLRQVIIEVSEEKESSKNTGE